MQGPDRYADGRPSWVDLATSDLDGAEAFYSALFGWHYRSVAGGGYRYALLDEHAVAGMAQGQSPELSPMWTTYLAVSSADEAADRVVAAGGSVIVAPMTVGPAGRMAYFADPTGAPFGVWQGDEHTGAAIINQPNAFTWADLRTDDTDAAAAFYNAAFGLGFAERDFGEDAPDYAVLTVGEQVVGGMTAPATPGSNHWRVYFGVVDADATAVAALAAGGEVVETPHDMAVGRMATLRDPQGANFSVVAFREWVD